jgi:F420-dependent oxidoreductase-like protein
VKIGLVTWIGSADDARFVADAERLGIDSVWTAEAWGYDALTPLAFAAASTTRIRLGSGIAQLGARSPALLAMSALTLQGLSGGRFVLGVGVSGPQVMEGWHGVRFTNPVQRTRETIEIVRTIARGDKLRYGGEIYTLPLPDGPGRALRALAPQVDIPIWVAALGPRNLRLTGELADGWLGQAVVPEAAGVFTAEIAAGAAAAGRTLDDVELSATAGLELDDDEEAVARRHARGYAFTIGAMGTADRNFYNDAFSRQGFADDVQAVQRLWLDGRRDEAADRVPLDLARRTNLLGPPERVVERLAAYRAAGITTLRVSPAGATPTERLDALAQLVDLAEDP